MTTEEFIKLFQEYVDSLDDISRDEYYTTEAGIAQRALDGFQEWLDIRVTKDG